MTESLLLYKKILFSIILAAIIIIYIYVRSVDPKNEENKKSQLNNIKQAFDLNIILIILSLALIIYILPIPNILGISDVNLTSNILNVTITALASILGIIIAVILVAFEILRNTYNLYAFNTFFNNKTLKRLISIFLMTISISYLNMLLLSDPLSELNIKYTYFSFFLFLASLFLLFPYLFNIITSTHSKKKIDEIINKLDSSIIEDLGWNGSSPIVYIDTWGEDPISTLIESGVNSLKNGNSYLSMLILTELESKFIEILQNQNLKEKNTMKKYINVYLLFLNRITYQAMDLKEFDILNLSLDSISNIYNFFVENKLSANEIVDLDKFLRDFITNAIKRNLDQLANRGIKLLGDITKNNLENNIPPENDVFTLQALNGLKIKDPDHDAELQWTHFAYNYVMYIKFASKEAINNNRIEVLKTSSSVLENLINHILNSSLSKTQKHSIIRNCIDYNREMTIEGIEKDLVYSPLNSVPFLSIKGHIKKDKEITKMELLSLFKILIFLDSKDLYDHFTYFLLGGLGRICISEIDKDDFYKEVVILIVDLFDKIRQNAKERKSDILYLYANFYDILKSFKELINKKDDKKLEDYVNKILSEFEPLKTKTESLKTESLEWKSYSDLN